MSEDGSRNVSLGFCRVLGDLTNSHGKRRFCSAPPESAHDNDNGFGKTANVKNSGDMLACQIQKGVENLVLGKENANLVLVSLESAPTNDAENSSFSKAKRVCTAVDLGSSDDEYSKEDAVLVAPGAPLEISEHSRSPRCDLRLLSGDSLRNRIIEGGGSKGSTSSSDKLKGSLSLLEVEFQDESGKPGTHIVGKSAGSDVVNEVPAMSAHDRTSKGKNVADDGQFFGASACNLQFVGSQESKTEGGESPNWAPLHKSSSAGWFGESGSLGSKTIGFEGPAKALVGCSSSGGSLPNSANGACSCASCLKAAFLLVDVHYQDARDRLAALKKSRRQVRQLIASYCHPEACQIGDECSDKPTKIELDLLNQWRSLFLHTEGILIRESNLVQSSILKLKDLRDDCERDLDMIRSVHPDTS